MFRLLSPRRACAGTVFFALLAPSLAAAQSFDGQPFDGQAGEGRLVASGGADVAASARVGVAVDPSRARLELDEPAFAYTVGIEGLLGGTLTGEEPVEAGSFTGGGGAFVGAPIGGWFEPQLRADLLHYAGGDDQVSLTGVAVMGGARVRLNDSAPLFFDAHAGYQWTFGADDGLRHGAVFDVGAGLRWAPCDGATQRLSNSAWTLALRGRIGAGGIDGESALYATVGYEYGGGSPVFETRCNEVVDRSSAEYDVEAAAEYGPMPSTQVIEYTPPAAEASATVVVEGDGSRRVEPEEPSEPIRVPLRFGFEGALGIADADYGLDGLAGGYGLSLDWRITRHFAIGARYDGLTAGDESIDLDNDGVDDLDLDNYDVQSVTGGPRLTIWSDEADRQGWNFEGDFGYAWATDARGPVMSFGISRQAGLFVTDGWSWDFGLGLRYVQGLADISDYRALLVTAEFASEFAVLDPEDDDRQTDFHYTFGVELFGGVGVSEQGAIEGGGQISGAALTFGVPVTAAIVPTVRAELQSRSTGEEQDPLVSWTGIGGVRVRMDEFLPMHFDAGIGYTFHQGTFADQVSDGGVVDVGLGFNGFCFDSDSRFEIGVRGRIALTEEGRPSDAILFTIGGTYASGDSMFEGDTVWCRMAESNRRAAARRQSQRRYQPAGSMGTLGTMPGADIQGGASVGGGVGVSGGVSVEGSSTSGSSSTSTSTQVEVEIEGQHRIDVEVPGGTVGVEVDLGF